MGVETVILAIIIGTLFAIVYSLRVLVLMERRMARIDMHIEALVNRVLSEEKKIEHEEALIAKQEGDIERILGLKTPRPPVKKAKPKKRK